MQERDGMPKSLLMPGRERRIMPLEIVGLMAFLTMRRRGIGTRFALVKVGTGLVNSVSGNPMTERRTKPCGMQCWREREPRTNGFTPTYWSMWSGGMRKPAREFSAVEFSRVDEIGYRLLALFAALGKGAVASVAVSGVSGAKGLETFPPAHFLTRATTEEAGGRFLQY